jgi:hypothetical protein
LLLLFVSSCFFNDKLSLADESDVKGGINDDGPIPRWNRDQSRPRAAAAATDPFISDFRSIVDEDGGGGGGGNKEPSPPNAVFDDGGTRPNGPLLTPAKSNGDR